MGASSLEVFVRPCAEQAEPEEEVEQGFEGVGRHGGSADPEPAPGKAFPVCE
jgi:hypothetical protein